MDLTDIARLRMANQRLIGEKLKKPEDVVRALGAVQAQEYGLSLWGLRQRMTTATEASIEEASIKGRILRTHAMRPTWHFFTSEDIRWILELTGPRVDKIMSGYYRQIGLDDTIFTRARPLIIRALEGDNHMTRLELKSHLKEKGIDLTPMQAGFIMSRAELYALVCSGARKGKQQTYALLEERAPQAKRLSLDEGLAELTKRYFTSHGPATIQDFMWWSGLPSGEIKRGLEMVKRHLTSIDVEGKTYWMTKKTLDIRDDVPRAYLLPPYDEFLISYKDRSASLQHVHRPLIDKGQNGVFSCTIMYQGQVIGLWKREIKGKNVLVTTKFFDKPTKTQNDAIAAAISSYGDFLGLPALWS
jgi:hypothetical protein